ncbi:non-specific lipid-transfer protein-like [Amaranthus tricolor]|uniref:non-specific lipid-transfer protein-like n=1 Tax=Amaranthus tricolor TaxID=29722 RepID=UPI002588197E|nr:non-specific lipid-transfer protein-like [Amaranthus tricolor]
MASSATVTLACVIMICMVLTAPHAQAAVTCGLEATKIAGCLGYLEGGSGPSLACCSGVEALKSAASTQADRKTACNCLKSMAAAIHNLDYGKAAGLPNKCGVSVPYAISLSTNCNAYVIL